LTKRWAVHASREELAFLLEAGVIYRDGKNFSAARDIFGGVSALMPSHEIPEILLGTVDFQEGKFSEARKHYQKALDSNPRSALAHAYLGEAWLFDKDKEKANAHFKSALSLDPTGESGKMARRLMEMSDRVTFV
jgi:tetratricopeptide (TPR) repeat protein